MNNLYFDSAATTQVRSEVIEKMQEALSQFYGNPSSTHSFGQSAKSLIERARKTIAKQLNAQPSEIIFTSGGTEADNMILRCAVRDLGVKTIITAKTEHHAVLHTAEQLEKEYGITVKFVVLDPDGTPNLEYLEHLLKQGDEKKLVSLMHVNNEIGNLLPVEEVASICKANDALFHSDTVQSIGHFEWDVQKTPIDFMTAAAHKFHGPKGVGFAYIRKDSGLKPLIFGGEQERGFRAGTEPMHNIVGLEEAFVQGYSKMTEERAYVSDLKRYFIQEFSKAFPEGVFNGASGDMEKSTYTLVNVGLPISEEKAQILLFHLDINGVACSKGSACQSGSTGASHVLSAFMSSEALKRPALRFSFSHYNTKEEIDQVIRILSDFAKS